MCDGDVCDRLCDEVVWWGCVIGMYDGVVMGMCVMGMCDEVV